MRNLLKKFARWLLRDELRVLHSALQSVTNAPVVREELRAVIPRERFDKVAEMLPKQVVGTTSTQLQCAALVGQQAAVEHFRRELTS